MPPLPSEWLRDIGVADFTPPAKRDIELYGHDWAGHRGVDASEQKRFQAFIEFGAVEFTLMPFYRGNLAIYNDSILENVPQPDPPAFPVRVTDRAAADAIYKTDCGPFREHRVKEHYELRAWDVFTFAGDMSKAELLGFSDINALAEPGNMQRLLDQLSERYSQAGLGSRVVESGLLRAQGLIWFAKLALLRGEDYTDTGGLAFGLGAH